MSKRNKIAFHGVTLDLIGDGTIFMPSEKVLIVSDLHLEKGAALSEGAPLPHFDTIDTLQRLERRIAACAPEQVICLGDSFHTIERAYRMPAEHVAFLSKLAEKTDFQWVTGNHDRDLPTRLPGAIHDELMISGIRLCHEADLTPCLPTISGHFHPKARIKLRARQVSCRCFIAAENDIIMPAFGSYTGGLNIRHEAFEPFLSKKTIIHLLHDGDSFAIPYTRDLFQKYQ